MQNKALDELPWLAGDSGMVPNPTKDEAILRLHEIRLHYDEYVTFLKLRLFSGIIRTVFEKVPHT